MKLLVLLVAVVGAIAIVRRRTLKSDVARARTAVQDAGSKATVKLRNGGPAGTSPSTTPVVSSTVGTPSAGDGSDGSLPSAD